MKTSNFKDAAPQFANPGKVACSILMIDESSSTSDHAVFKQPNGSALPDDRSKSDRFTEGLKLMKEILAGDHWFAASGELATVTFGSDVKVTPFRRIADWQPPTLNPDGTSATGAALNAALDLGQDRTAELDDLGILYYRLQIILITDGMPYGEHPHFLTAAIERAREAERAGHASFVTIGVDESDRDHLGTFFQGRCRSSSQNRSLLGRVRDFSSGQSSRRAAAEMLLLGYACGCRA